MARQYVAVKFKPEYLRSYTFHNDGETIAVGDRIEVLTRRGPAIGEVVEVTSEAPIFSTTRVLGPAPKEPEKEAAA